MYLTAYLLKILAAFFRLSITTVKGAPDPMGGTEQAGALIPNGAALQQFQALQANASPAFGNWALTIIPTIAAATYNAAAMTGGFIRRMNTASAGLTDCTDTATNIVNAIPGAKVNQSFPTIIANLGSGAITVAAGAGVTLAGTNVIGGFSGRVFVGQVTGSGAVTFTSAFGFSLGSSL